MVKQTVPTEPLSKSPTEQLGAPSRLPIAVDSPLLLASASPRRAEILHGLGLPLRTRPSNVPEEAQPGESPDDFVARVVTDKLEAALAAGGFDGCAAALAADTIVLVDNEVLGKPMDTRQALEFLERLAGRVHHVKTRYCIELPGAERRARTISSAVCMREASRAELERYAATGEGLDKAGGYAVQGIGAFLVQSIQGSYTNVVGLPACEVIADLVELGVLRDFPRASAGQASTLSF